MRFGFQFGLAEKKQGGTPIPSGPIVQIRYTTSTNDIESADLYADYGHTPYLVNNGNGTYDLCCDTPTTFIGLAPSGYYGNYNYYLQIEAITLISVSTLTRLYDDEAAEYGTGPFCHMSAVAEFDASKLTSVVDAKRAWEGCSDLEIFNASGLRAATNIYGAWRDCESLETFDTSNLTSVIDIRYAWSGCESLETFDMSGLSNAVLAVSAWDTCSELRYFDTSILTSVTTASRAWRNCTGLISFNATGLVATTDLQYAWSDCDKLKCVSSFTAPLANASRAFSPNNVLVHPNNAERTAYFTANGVYWNNLESCDGANAGFKAIVHAPTQEAATPIMLTGINATVPYTLSNDEIVANKDGSWTFETATVITGVRWDQNTEVTKIHLIKASTVAHFIEPSNNNGWTICKGCTALTDFVCDSYSPDLESVDKAWQSCTSLKGFDTTGLDAGSIEGAWSGCSSLTHFNAAGLTSVIAADRAWDGCSALTEFDTEALRFLRWARYTWRNCRAMTTFNTRGLGKLQNAFMAWGHCTALTSFDASVLQNVTDIRSAWESCENLVGFDTEGLNKATSVELTWYGCKGLISFNTRGLTAVTNMRSGWQSCDHLISFDATGLTAIINMSEAWYGCHSLVCISSFKAPSVTSVYNAFGVTQSLVHPDAAEQAASFTTTGVDWTNPTTCP